MRERTKLVVKHRINIDQRTKRLLLSIEEEKQFLQNNRGLRKQFGSKIDTLEEALLKLPPQKNNLAILLKLEKDFHTLDTQIDGLAKQKHRNYALMLHAVVGVKVLIFMGAYFRLIPQNSLALHPSIYIAAAALLLLVWILYFTLLEKSYQILFLYAVKPLAAKHPRYRRQIYWTAACTFNAATFSPLMTVIQIFPSFINPHWDTFLINIADIIVRIFTSNAITSVVNILAIFPCILFLYQKVWKRVRK